MERGFDISNLVGMMQAKLHIPVHQREGPVIDISDRRDACQCKHMQSRYTSDRFFCQR